MEDLTVIFLTCNEHPDGWTRYHRDVLEKAVSGFSLITISRKPMDFGKNIIDNRKKSHLNMYIQLLRACKEASTPYIATAEDDALYPPEHFRFYRPPLDTIAYDMSRWSLYWWEPIYSVKQRISNCTLIAPREEYIDALEERLNKLKPDRPELVSEVGRYERNIGVKPRKIARVYCDVPTIHFNSPSSTDHLIKNKKKKLGQLRAYDIPYWGKASDIISKYK